MSLNDEYSIYRARNSFCQVHREHHSLLSRRIKETENLADQLQFFLRVCLFSDSNFAEDYLTQMGQLNREREDFYYLNIRNIFFRVFTDHFSKRQFDNFEILLFNFDNEQISSFQSTLFIKFEFESNSQLVVSPKFQDGYFRAQNFLIKLRMLYLRFKQSFRRTIRVRLDLVKVTRTRRGANGSASTASSASTFR